MKELKEIKDLIEISKETVVGWHWLDNDTFVSEFRISEEVMQLLDTNNNSIEIEYQEDTGEFIYSTYDGDWDDYMETNAIAHTNMSPLNGDVLKFIEMYAKQSI